MNFKQFSGCNSNLFLYISIILKGINNKILIEILTIFILDLSINFMWQIDK